MIRKLKAYVQLTKPSIMLLVILTGSSTLVMEGSFTIKPLDFILVVAGLFLTGGSANALNQYFERDLDALMTRTRKRRPLPMGQVTPGEALFFAIAIGLLGVAIFALRFNLLSAGLALGTILFYGFFYTLILKPSTHQNIVIGGIAGAMAPVISWAAVANSLALEPWLLFMIIFLWTPPHFWALALYLKEDYKLVKLPMLPIEKGDDYTLSQMLYYTVALVAVSFILIVVNEGYTYPVAAVVFGGIFIRKCIYIRKHKSRSLEMGLFRYSIIYLFAIFSTIIFDGLVKIGKL